MISIAIIGILTAIIFTNFSQEKDRNALKSAVHQLQTDLQAMQTNAQGGVLTGNTVQNGYGIYFNKANFLPSPPNPSSRYGYILFADATTDTLGYLENPSTPSPDTNINTRVFPLGISIPRLADAVGTSYSRVDLVFVKPDGRASINAFKESGGNDTPTSVTVTLKSAKLDICYAITVTANVGTVSKRQLASCT
ncbi:MAG: hypothetical protein AAB402_01515 [Patescibacteria group bacterium]